jgi:hypothetical protein
MPNLSDIDHSPCPEGDAFHQSLRPGQAPSGRGARYPAADEIYPPVVTDAALFESDARNGQMWRRRDADPRDQNRFNP